MKKLVFLSAGVAILTGAGAAGATVAKDLKPTDVIEFSTSSVVSPFYLGAGVQWSAYPHADSDDALWGPLVTDAKWNTLYERVDYMKPRFMRVCDQANWRYFEKLDANGVPVISFENQKTRALFKILDYCQKNSIVVLLGEWGIPGWRHDRDKPEIRLRDVTDTRWHKMIAQWVDYLINKKGYTCIKYYGFINEPNGAWACTNGNFAEWAAGVMLLNKEFESRGLTGKIEICGPGSVPNANVPQYKGIYEGHLWTDYAHEVVGDILGAYDTHAYYPHAAARERTAAELMFFSKDVAIAHGDNKPFFLGEIGLKATKDKGEFVEEHERRRLADGWASQDCNMYVYDYFFGLDISSVAIQSINAGVDAMAAWDLDDAMHTKDDLGDKHSLKRWGFWNILGTEICNNPADENIRPWYWAWSWLCRYLPPKSQIYKVGQPSNRGCQLLVAKVEGGYSVYVSNTSDTDVVINLKCPSIPELKNINQLIYNQKYEGQDKPFGTAVIKSFDISKGATVNVPAKTFTVLTTMPL